MAIPQHYALGPLINKLKSHPLGKAPRPATSIVVSSKSRRRPAKSGPKKIGLDAFCALLSTTLSSPIPQLGITHPSVATPCTDAAKKNGYVDFEVRPQGQSGGPALYTGFLLGADQIIDKELVWILLHGAQPHDEGWLESKVDWIAIQADPIQAGSVQANDLRYNLFDREQLNAFIYSESGLDISSTTSNASEALGKLYKRGPHHREIKTLLSLKDMMDDKCNCHIATIGRMQ